MILGKEAFLKFKYFTIITCHIPHVLILLGRNCANLGNIYGLSETELTFLKLSLLTGLALVIKLCTNTFVFFFSCQKSHNILKLFMVLYMMDIMAGLTIIIDSFIRNKLWNDHSDVIHKVYIAEILYLVLLLFMAIIELCCMVIYKRCIEVGHFRRRTVSNQLKQYLKEPLKLRIN